jgi:hypothetical protein
MLKDWGYYYHKCDINTAVKHIRNIKEYGFNRKEYIDRHKPLLEKYSIKNPEYINFFNKKFSSGII